MEYRQIVAVTGLSGLYQLLSTKKDGAIVRSLSDKSTKFVSARIHQITPLESIEIYTTDDNARLHEVLEKISENDGPIAGLNGKKDDKAARAYFKEILPNFDEERVYTSDIKKVLKWYQLLKDNDLLHFDYLKAPMAETEDAAELVAEETPETEKPKKKAATKKAADTEEAAEEKPMKKAPAKKKATAEQETEAEAAPKKATKKKKEEG